MCSTKTDAGWKSDFQAQSQIMGFHRDIPRGIHGLLQIPKDKTLWELPLHTSLIYL